MIKGEKKYRRFCVKINHKHLKKMFAAIVRVYKDLQFGQQLSSNSFVFFITVIPNGPTMTFNILTSGCVVSHCEQTTLNIFFNETFQTSTNSIAITLHNFTFQC